MHSFSLDLLGFLRPMIKFRRVRAKGLLIRQHFFKPPSGGFLLSANLAESRGEKSQPTYWGVRGVPLLQNRLAVWLRKCMPRTSLRGVRCAFLRILLHCFFVFAGDSFTEAVISLCRGFRSGSIFKNSNFFLFSFHFVRDFQE